jgi:iron complex outermembrane receptor protein
LDIKKPRTSGRARGIALAVALCVLAVNVSAADKAQDEGSSSLSEIVVTGSREKTAVKQVPVDVSVITEADLRKPGVNGYQEAARIVPGVKINARQEGDIGTSGIEVRGLDSNPTSGNNVLILLDGIPQRRLSFGGPYVGGLPYDALTRMELVKGPAASLYGRGATAGALQLFSSPGTKDWEVQTWNTFESPSDYAKTAWRLSGPLDREMGATFSLTGSGSYTGGWQPRTEGEQGNGYLHVRLPITENDTVSIMAGYFSGKREMAAPVLINKNGDRLPGIDRDENLSVPDQNSLDTDEIRAGVVWDRDWTEELSSKLSFGYWHGDTYWKVGRPDDRPAAGTVINRSSSNRPWHENYFFSELQLSQDYMITEEVTGTLIGGGNLEYSTYRSSMQSIWSPGSNATRGILLDTSTMAEPDPSTWINGPMTTRDTTEWDPGVFLKNRFTFLDRVDLDAGIRFDRFERHQENLNTGAASTVYGDSFSPSVGLSVQIIKDDPHVLAAYASWGRAFSPVYRSVGTTEIVDVPPETSQSYEVGLKGSYDRGKIEGTLAFYRQERNNVVGNLTPTVVTNIGDWQIDGVELGLKARPITGLTFFGSYTRRDPRMVRDISDPVNSGKLIPFVAEEMFTTGVEYQHKCGVFAGLANYYVGPTFADNYNTIHLNNYYLVNTYVGYRWKELEVSVFVRNMLDEEYFSAVFAASVVRNGSAFEGTPRSVGVSLSYRF